MPEAVPPFPTNPQCLVRCNSTHKNLLLFFIFTYPKTSCKFIFQTAKFSWFTPLFNDSYINHKCRQLRRQDAVDIRRGDGKMNQWPWDILLKDNKNCHFESNRTRSHPTKTAATYSIPGKCKTNFVPRCERKTQNGGVQEGSGGGSIWHQATWDDNEPECTQWGAW
jgi:hypothetical protein